MTQPTDHVTALARRMAIDIDLATYPAVDYSRLYGVEELKPVDELRTESDEDYDDDGAMREMVTGHNSRLEIKLLHRTAADGVTFNAVHQFLKAKFEAAKSSTAAGEFGMRVYDRSGREDAKQGRAYVKAWSPDGGNPGARDTITLTLQFQGPTELVTNPMANLDPVVTSLVPATGDDAGGNLVTIRGSHLNGATAVTFGANPADEYTVVDPTRIVAVAPAGTAGTVQVTVTTPEGTSSTSGSGNDYAYTA